MTKISASFKSYDEEVIRKMYEKSFNCSSENITISKLSGGLKNAVYLIEENSQKFVLKIGPKDENRLISADKNIFGWEAEILKFMKQIDFPAPELLYFDDSGEICDAPYIFMSYIEGYNFLEVKDKLSEEEIKNIETQLGELSLKICSIKGDKFFLPAQPDKNFNNNYEFVLNLFELLLNDAKSQDLYLGENVPETIYSIINASKESLNNITNLCLCHTDIWDGNVLIKNGNVTGVVDFSDLYYCDELMTFYFHTIDGKTSENFLKGFGNKVLNKDEKIRIEIYRMYVILKMIVDCKLKDYGRFDWMYENLNTRIRGLIK